MNIQTHTHCAEEIIRICGELCGRDAVDLLRVLRESRQSSIVIDLSELVLIDSRGIGALIYSQKLLENTSRQFSVIPPPPALRQVFEDYGLDETLPMVEHGSAMAA